MTVGAAACSCLVTGWWRSNLAAYWPTCCSLTLYARCPAFVINHSVEYTVAALASWGEFWVELLLFPGLKRSWLTLLLGLVLVSAGQACRVLAMHTAKSNFSHIIMEKRETNHQLVTWGIYRCAARRADTPLPVLEETASLDA